MLQIATQADPACAIGPAWQPAMSALGPDFYAPVDPRPLEAPYWVDRNDALARELGLEDGWLQSQEALMGLSGCAAPAGSRPIASVYSGHQFGVWAGQLGDGRALILGEIPTAQGPIEVQIKGGGRTPFSRMGDGRAVLRSSIREYLCSEAMHGLGIATTRALALTGSPSRVLREEVETAAVVTRTAASFLRFGHFEHFSQVGQEARLQKLADHVLDRFYPQCRDAASPYAALLGEVVERTARLIARWQAVGFCHGVMNTDNMSVLGLTLDYGPFQFLDAFDPSHICNHSDSQGRYAYKRQPAVAQWNLYCLGQALLPLIGSQDDALAALERYRSTFEAALTEAFRAKLGLSDAHRAEDLPLIETLLQTLAANRVDYTLFWRRLCDFHVRREAVRDLFMDRAAFDAWAQRYEARCAAFDPQAQRHAMRSVNPKYVLRNYLAEQAIAAAKQGDFEPVRQLRVVLHAPYDDHPDHEAWAGLPPDWASSIEISCSS
jgi:uncharacterized protein YdiU (UPF0061 family)